VLERLIDLLSILSFLAAGLAATEKVELPTGLKMSALLVAAGATVVLIVIVLWSKVFAERLQRPKPSGEYLEAFVLLLSSFDAMSRPAVLVGIFLLSTLAWTGEAGLFWALLIPRSTRRSHSSRDKRHNHHSGRRGKRSTNSIRFGEVATTASSAALRPASGCVAKLKIA